MVVTSNFFGNGPLLSTFGKASSPFLVEGDYVKTKPSQILGGKVKRQNEMDGRQSPMIFDTTSEQAFWNSFNRCAGMIGTEDEQRVKDLPIVGMVKRVWHKEKVAVVSIWKRGDEYLVDGRPEETFPLSKVLKITKSEFNRTCKKQYMVHKQFSLTLKADGHDESMPISLIAHHNKIISDLLDRTDDSGKGKNKAAGLNAIDDPFSGIRDELRKVTADIGSASYVKGRKRGAKQAAAQQADASQSHAPSPAPTEEVWDRTIVLDHARPFAVVKGGSSRPSSRMARVISGFTDGIHQGLKGDLTRRRDKLTQQIMRDGMLIQPREGWRTPGLADVSDVVSISDSNPNPNSSTSTDMGLSLTVSRVSRLVQELIVNEVEEEGRLGIAACNDPAVTFVAVLDGVKVPHSATVQAFDASLNVRLEISKVLLGKRVQGTRVGYDPQGHIRLDMVLDQTSVQEELVRRGLARVDGSLLDEVDEKYRRDGLDDAQPHRFGFQTALLRHQETAMHDKRGIWKVKSALSNFLEPDPFVGIPAEMKGFVTEGNLSDLGVIRDVTPQFTSLMADTPHMGDPVLPSLFDYQQSSQTFRMQLSVVQQAKLNRRLKAIPEGHLDTDLGAGQRSVPNGEVAERRDPLKDQEPGDGRDLRSRPGRPGSGKDTHKAKFLDAADALSMRSAAPPPGGGFPECA
uniref:Uncharacterized protein n=1 Tax=Eutreptiella gymnastica TaxID=73025 RepID=A0A7S1N2A7_9EUGL|mmetsp:Transcript_106782/g.184194  ORF Transcript_106782/g.184194 Transcript_106782/m.184194 type:complete len:685 (+) Transcript_106782:130-2184(+)